MLTWLSANLINIVLVAVLALIVTLLIRGMIRDRRAGKSSCGASCGGTAFKKAETNSFAIPTNHPIICHPERASSESKDLERTNCHRLRSFDFGFASAQDDRNGFCLQTQMSTPFPVCSFSFPRCPFALTRSQRQCPAFSRGSSYTVRASALLWCLLLFSYMTSSARTKTSWKQLSTPGRYAAAPMDMASCAAG